MTLETLRARLDTAEAPAATTLYDRVHGLAELVAGTAPDGTVDDVATYLTTAYSVLRNNATLARCEWATIAGAIMTGARLGLSFSPELGHAWLIPRKVAGQWTAVFQLGYRGVLELARRSGRVGNVTTGVVWHWDELDAVEGTESRLVIRRDYTRGHGPDPVGYWCVVELLDGSRPAWSLITRDEAEAIRAGIPGATDARSAWSAHFDSMAQVAAFRRLRSMLPLSVELEHALAVDGTAVRHTATITDGRGGVSAELAALDDDTGPPSPLSIAEGGDIPDGEPWAPPEDAAPSSPAGATPPTAPAGDEPLDDADAAVEAEPDPPPRPRMPALRDWARRHRLTTVLDTAPRNVAGCLEALGAALDVDPDTVADWVITDHNPEEPAG